jgi:hypothetical protein
VFDLADLLDTREDADDEVDSGDEVMDEGDCARSGRVW